MVNYRRRRGQAKLQPELVGPYAVVEVIPNHTYKIVRSGQVSIQYEAHLKPYWASPDAPGEAPPPPPPLFRRRHGLKYEVVVPREEDLARNERPLPLTEVCPPSLTRGLTPSLPDPELGPEVQNPLRGRSSIQEKSGKNK